ncbi:MAG: DNA repair protein RecO C-terminal domain-containing protein [Desulfovibrionaceae bacterium]|jgi:DNA repair protein RecO (recombination protein O)|nr:DNA repair protein RecO C-terminal domain-containing protein [Desulfovibrionaceae bacterium]
MDFTERVLILKIGRFREADIWLRTLSPTRGVLTAFAFGGSRSRRRFSGCLDALNVVEFAFRPSRCGDYLSVAEGELVAAPERLRRDWQRLGIAVNCLKFLEALQYDEKGARTAYDLALDALDALEIADSVPPVFALLFRARVAFGLGFEPALGFCARCGAPLVPQTPGDAVGEGACAPGPGWEDLPPDAPRPRFLLDQGCVECADCQRARGRAHGMPVSPGTLDTLQAVGRTMPSQWPHLRLAPNVLKECSRAVDGFVQYHLGLAWERGGFRRV